MTWSHWFDLTPQEVASEAPTTCGVFCVACKGEPLAYPIGSSTAVFFGMTDDRQRGLRAVLAELAAGRRRDLEQQGREHGGLRFCFQANLGDGARPLLSAVLDDFVRQHGGLPRCNSTAH